MSEFISQIEPWFGQEETHAIQDYMSSGGWLTEFRKTEEFENMISDYTSAKHCIVVNNGTISLTLAALACGIKHGDEVIIPNYTMIASPNSVKLIGAEPVFVDVEPNTLCMDIELLKKAVTDKTHAVLFMNANGRYPTYGIDELEQFCLEEKLILIEDSAQALGSFYPDGSHMGLVGIVGSISFSMPKIITTGQGGALITNSDEIADKLRTLKDFGRISSGVDMHDTFGINSKFTDLQAVIGIEQMKKLGQRVERKKEIWARYKENLKNLSQIIFFQQDILNTTPWFIDVLVEDRHELMNHLKDNDIGSRVMYPPIHSQKVYMQNGKYPVSEMIGEKGLWLPSSSQLRDSQIDLICNTISDFYKKV